MKPVGCHQLVFSLTALQCPSGLHTPLRLGHGVGCRQIALQNGEQLHGLFTSCPSVVMSQRLELAMKYRPGCESVKIRWFHYDGDTPCVPALHISFGHLLSPILFRTPSGWLSGRIESRRVDSTFRRVTCNWLFKLRRL
jgi:hypothetical protein